MRKKIITIVISSFFLLVLMFSSNLLANGNVNDNTSGVLEPTKSSNTPVAIPSADELSFYDIAVNYSVTTHTATGWLNVSYLNTETVTLDEVYFHIWPNALLTNGLVINQIVDGNDASVTFTTEAVVNLKVKLLTPVIAGSRSQININFTTTLPDEQSRFGYTTDPGRRVHAFGNWHPVLSVYENGLWNKNPYAFGGEGFYTDLAYYNISVTTTSDLIIAAAGDFVSSSDNNNMRTHVWTAGPVRDFTFVASPDFEVVNTTTDTGIFIASYYFPEHELRGKDALIVTSQSLDLFSDIFEPWPYKSASIVELQAWFGGMEYNQLVMIAQNYYNTTERDIWAWRRVISHEWSHSWNTYLVGNNPWIDPWLDESWASYASVLYFERYFGSGVGQLDFWKFAYFDYMINNTDLPIGKGMEYWESNPGIGRIVYAKGAYFISFIRTIMGDELFLETIEAYYDEFAYKTVTTDQFVAFFETFSGLELSWLFNQYLEIGVVPLTYQISSALYSDTGDNWKISYSILQTHDDSPVTMRVPVKITFTDGSPISDWIWVNETIETINVIVPKSSGTPKSIILDPDNLLMREDETIDLNFQFFDPEAVSTPDIVFSIGSLLAISTITMWRRKR